MDNLNKSGQNPLQMQQTNPITLLKNPCRSDKNIEKFKQTFQQIANISSQALKTQQYQKALKALNKCADMLDVGKNILKDISKYWKLCINANLACTYQGTWKMQKCNKYCEKVQQEIQRMLEISQTKQNYLNLSRSLIRLQFQHCAILSQLNQHQKALQLCKSTLGCLQKYIRSILEYTQSLNTNHQDNNKSSQTIQFSKQVTNFAQQILHNLLRNLNQPLSSTTTKTSFYYWQRNPQNNEDQVKKKFVSQKNNTQCKRSILGVNKMTHWIDQFNIGTIMHMSQLTIKDFQNCLPVQQYIFKDKLYETVIYCSVAHFTIATQMRFIQSNRDKQKEKQQNGQKDKPDQQNKLNLLNNQNSTLSTIIKKYGFKQKSQMFRMSQLYHLRAIHIIAQNIKSTVPYISHLIKSYDKNYIYKKQLQPVIAIDQQSLVSLNQTYLHKKIQLKHQPQQQQQQQNYFYTTGTSQQAKQIKASHNNLTQNGTIENDQDMYSLKNAKIVQSKKLQRKIQLQGQNTDYLLPKIKNRNKSQCKTIKTTRQNRDKATSKLKTNTHEDVERKIKKQKKKKNEKTIKQKKQPRSSNQDKDKDTKQKNKKKDDDIEGQVRINHQSCTQIKVLVFKKKK